MEQELDGIDQFEMKQVNEEADEEEEDEAQGRPGQAKLSDRAENFSNEDTNSNSGEADLIQLADTTRK